MIPGNTFATNRLARAIVAPSRTYSTRSCPRSSVSKRRNEFMDATCVEGASPPRVSGNWHPDIRLVSRTRVLPAADPLCERVIPPVQVGAEQAGADDDRDRHERSDQHVLNE